MTEPIRVVAALGVASVPLAVWAMISTPTTLLGRTGALLGVIVVLTAAVGLGRRASIAAAVWTLTAAAVQVPAIVGFIPQLPPGPAWLAWAACAVLWWSHTLPPLIGAVNEIFDDADILHDAQDDAPEPAPAARVGEIHRDGWVDEGALQISYEPTPEVVPAAPRTVAIRTRLDMVSLDDEPAPTPPPATPEPPPAPSPAEIALAALPARRAVPGRRTLVSDLAFLARTPEGDVGHELARCGIRPSSDVPVRPLAFKGEPTRRPSVTFEEIEAWAEASATVPLRS